MARAKRVAKPTIYQTKVLGWIARSPLMKTIAEDGVRWSLQNGRTVPEETAKVLIRNGWVVPVKDGMFDDPQTYTALKAPGLGLSAAPLHR